MFEQISLREIPPRNRHVLAVDVWVFVEALSGTGNGLWRYLVNTAIFTPSSEVRWVEYAPDRPYGEVFDQRIKIDTSSMYYASQYCFI